MTTVKQKEACRIFWDYYGPQAHSTAIHFRQHLIQWLERAETQHLSQGHEPGQYVASDVGVTTYSPTHSAAYCVLSMTSGQEVYRTLRAHRAVLEHPSSEE